MPNLREGCFEQAVVLICSHDEEHAMGVIINKEVSDLTFKELLAQLGIEPLGLEYPVHFGGPVETKRGVVLHSDDYKSEDTVQICPGVGLTATKQILEDLNTISMTGSDDPGKKPEQAVLCMGHAGWAPGQLEDELAQNAWLHVLATPDLVFGGQTDKTWDKALAAIGVTSSMFSPEWSDLRDPDQPLN